MKDSKLRNLTANISKIVEIILIVATVLVIVACLVIGIGTAVGTISEGIEDGFISNNTNGIFVKDGHLQVAATIFYMVSIAINAVLMAIIFRNINHIFRKSNTASPFSEYNVKKIKQIGYIAIAIPLINLVFYVVASIIARSNNVSMSFSLSEIVFGLVALTLSQYFAYGAKLEKDVDGLV